MSFMGAIAHVPSPGVDLDVTNNTSTASWSGTEAGKFDVPEQERITGSGRTHLSVLDGGASLVGLRPGDEQWQELALCAQTDPESFFPEKGGSTREAKRICTGCEVRDACLEYSLAHDERFGIWGGLSERERRRLKRVDWDADAV